MSRYRPESTNRDQPGNETNPAPRQRLAVWRSGYWLVLILLGVSFFLCAFQSSPTPGVAALLSQLVTVAATFWVARVSRTIQRTVWVVLSATGLAAIAVQVAGWEGYVLDIILSSASLAAYLIAPVAIIRHQFRKASVDGETLLASIAAYVMVGMCFTFVYSLISLTTPMPLFGEGNEDSLTTQLFFSFTTLTTTGYGNLVPTGAVVQSIAIGEAITGQLFLVIAVAKAVSGWQPPRR